MRMHSVGGAVRAMLWSVFLGAFILEQRAAAVSRQSAQADVVAEGPSARTQGFNQYRPLVL
jgi:hypothetical protein